MLSFNSIKAGLLKNVQKHLSRCFGSREMSKTKAGSFFLKHFVLSRLGGWVAVLSENKTNSALF